MKVRMIGRIMSDDSEVWEVEMWQDDKEPIVLSFISFKKGQEFVNNLRLSMESCTVEYMVEEESLLSKQHC